MRSESFMLPSQADAFRLPVEVLEAPSLHRRIVQFVASANVGSVFREWVRRRAGHVTQEMVVDRAFS